MKTMNNLALAVVAAAALIAGGDNSTRAATGGPTGKVQPKTELQGTYMTDNNDNVEKRDLVITRLFAAPIERVWRAWTDPEYVMRWWGPTGFTSPLCRTDFREG